LPSGKKQPKNPLQSPQNEVITEFTSSLPFDRELYFWDIVGSLAHVDALAEAGIVTQKEQKSLKSGLKSVLKSIQEGEAELLLELEDIHMNVESLLSEEIGALAGKLHTGRSRNDQGALDLRLYVRERVLETLEELMEFQKVLIRIAKKNLGTIMPGMTHLQPAQPVSLAHHLMAYWFKMKRDFDRLVGCYERLNFCPLGSGALSGSSYGIDRFELAKSLNFRGPTDNSMDSVSDRDFAVESVFCLSLIMEHLSSLAEEIILWNSPQFGFIHLSPDFTTGSSMMPQKRNPDIAELTRGKVGRVAGDLVSLLTVLKGLPLTYNRDLQEDKEPVFDAFDTAVDSLWAMRNLLSTAKFDSIRMEEACKSSNLHATDLADYLVGMGMPFREAYSLVKKMIEDSSGSGSSIDEWTIKDFQKYSTLFKDDVKGYLELKNVMNRREVYGGTSEKSVGESISLVDALAKEESSVIRKIRDDVEKPVLQLLR